MRAFGPGTKYRRCLSKCGNKGKNGCKSAGKIGKILGKILYNCELITEQAFDLNRTAKVDHQNDKLYSKILGKLNAHTTFECKDRLVVTKNLIK